MRTIAVLTSGGDAPGMNTAIRTVAKVAASAGIAVVGVEAGYEGLMEGRLRALPLREVDTIGHEGGTVLGSARSAAFRTREGRLRAARRLKEADISGLIVIGGNGSLTGAHLLATETGTQVVGLPASIDNDIGATSTAIGVDTALNTIVEACDRISDTARAHHRAFVVEVMGRDCGYLAMASAAAVGADAVLFRERGQTEAEVVAAVEATIRRGFSSERDKRRVLVIKAEGVEVPCTRLVRLLQARIPGAEIRATVLGHLVRGGNPSFQDRLVASRLSLTAVHALLSGSTDVMMAWQPNAPGGTPTGDDAVQSFPLAAVLAETAALLDGSSPVTQRRVKMLMAIEGVLSL